MQKDTRQPVLDKIGQTFFQIGPPFYRYMCNVTGWMFHVEQNKALYNFMMRPISGYTYPNVSQIWEASNL